MKKAVETFSIAFALLSSAFSAILGLSPLRGAFAAGMALAKSKVIIRVKEFVRHLNLVFVPSFFSVIRAQVNFFSFEPSSLFMILMLTVIGVTTKMIGAAISSFLYLKDWTKAMHVSVGMVPRSEVGLIIAGIGITLGIISEKIYGEVVGMIIITTMIAPILLSRMYLREGLNASYGDP